MIRRASLLVALVAIGQGIVECRSLPADERLKGIACRSVHLAYAAPEGVAFYNEVAVDRSAEGTCFCVCGSSWSPAATRRTPTPRCGNR